MESKHLRAVLVLVPCLLGLLVGCGPAAFSDVTLSAPPDAVKPEASAEENVKRLSYDAPNAAKALAYAADELTRQGFERCPNTNTISWRPYAFERDGQRVSSIRYEELLFHQSPPRQATLAMVKQPQGVHFTVEITPLVNTELVVRHRDRFCRSLRPRY